MAGVGVVASAGADTGVTHITLVAGAAGTHLGGDPTPITALAGAGAAATGVAAGAIQAGAGVVVT